MPPRKTTRRAPRKRVTSAKEAEQSLAEAAALLKAEATPEQLAALGLGPDPHNHAADAALPQYDAAAHQRPAPVAPPPMLLDELPTYAPPPVVQSPPPPAPVRLPAYPSVRLPEKRIGESPYTVEEYAQDAQQPQPFAELGAIKVEQQEQGMVGMLLSQCQSLQALVQQQASELHQIRDQNIKLVAVIAGTQQGGGGQIQPPQPEPRKVRRYSEMNDAQRQAAEYGGGGLLGE